MPPTLPWARKPTSEAEERGDEDAPATSAPSASERPTITELRGMGSDRSRS